MHVVNEYIHTYIHTYSYIYLVPRRCALATASRFDRPGRLSAWHCCWLVPFSFVSHTSCSYELSFCMLFGVAPVCFTNLLAILYWLLRICPICLGCVCVILGYILWEIFSLRIFSADCKYFAYNLLVERKHGVGVQCSLYYIIYWKIINSNFRFQGKYFEKYITKDSI